MLKEMERTSSKLKGNGSFANRIEMNPDIGVNLAKFENINQTMTNFTKDKPPRTKTSCGKRGSVAQARSARAGKL